VFMIQKRSSMPQFKVRTEIFKHKILWKIRGTKNHKIYFHQNIYKYKHGQVESLVYNAVAG
jgi:hypothetical protein